MTAKTPTLAPSNSRTVLPPPALAECLSRAGFLGALTVQRKDGHVLSTADDQAITAALRSYTEESGEAVTDDQLVDALDAYKAAYGTTVKPAKRTAAPRAATTAKKRKAG